MFSTFYTPCQQLTRRAHVIVATLVTLVLGFGIASAQQLESEFISPLRVTDSPSVLFDKGLVELQVDDALLQEMAKGYGEILVKDFPVNEYETLDLVVEQFFPYRGDIHEPYYATDSKGNRVVRKRPIEITAKCFRGHVAGYPESKVFFGMNKEMCNGFIQYGETRHTISTDPATQVIAVSDPLAEQPGLQLVREMLREAVVNQGGDQGNFRGLDNSGNDIPPPAGCGQITLSVVYGTDFLALFSGQTAANNYIITLIGQVSVMFRSNGLTWVEMPPLVGQIFNGTGSVDDPNLPQVLCDFVELSVGTTIPDVTFTGTNISDGYLIFRAGANGAIAFGGAQTTKQSLGYWGGLTTGINPAAANPQPGPPAATCPAGSNVNAVGAASGLIGGNDTTGYDTYIVAQALGTLCGATPTGAFGNITAIVYNAFAGGPLPGVAAGLGNDFCDTNNPGLGTIMSSCMVPAGATMANNIDPRFATANIVAMNALLLAPTNPLVTPGTLAPNSHIPPPATGVAATTGGAGNCSSVNVTWVPDPAATAQTIWRNSQNVWLPGTLGGAYPVGNVAGGVATFRDMNLAGETVYFYWVTGTNSCDTIDTNVSLLIADIYNPAVNQPVTGIPGLGVRGTIGDRPPGIPVSMATVYANCSSITVTWDLTNQFGGYVGGNQVQIWRNTVDIIPDPDTSAPLATVVIGVGTYLDDDVTLVQDTTYYYWVTPIDTNCAVPNPQVEDNSAAGILQPDLAGTFMRVGASNGSRCDGVLVSWIPEITFNNANFNFVDGYQVWRQGPFDGGPNQIVFVPAFDNFGNPATEFLDGTAQPQMQYQYWLLAQNECSASDMQLVSGIGTTGELAKPIGVLVEETNPADPSSPACGDLKISWNEVVHAEWYQVWRSVTNDFTDVANPPMVIGLTSDLSFVDTPPVPGLVYFYWISASSRTCDNLSGDNHSTTEFGSSLPLLVQPTNLVASKSDLCSNILLSWDGAFDGTTYTVYRNTGTDDFNDVGTVSIGSIDDLGDFDDPQDADGSQPDPAQFNIYYYWVVADNECGTTSESDSDAGTLANPLAAPIGLDATAGSFCNGIQISWAPRVLASEYRVYKNIVNDPTGGAGEMLMIQTVPSSDSSFDDTTAVPGVTYYYWVEAVNTCSTGVLDPATDLQAVAAVGLNGNLIGPSGISATDGTNCGYVELSWDAVDLANNYQVWQNTTNDFATALNVGETPSTTYQDETVVDKTLYYYWVTTDTSFCAGADQSAGVTGWAMTDLAVVTGVSAGQGSECSGLDVTWDPVTNILEYEIFRNETGDAPVGGDLIGTTTEQIFTDSTAVQETNYYYWVQATTSCGTGEFSDESYGYLAEPLSPPTFVGQSDSGNCNDIAIGWLVVDGADDYSIYKSTSDLFSDSDLLAQNITTTQFTDVAVTAGQTFFYWVLANNACGLSGESSSAQAANTTLDNPSVVTTETGCSEVTVSWDSITDASGYSIYRTDADIAPVPGGPNPGDVAIAQTFGVGATTHVDDTVVPQTLYYYWVVTNNVACQTLPGISTAGAAVAQPVAPDGLGSTNGDCGAVTVSWTDFAWDVTYHVYRNETGIPPTPDLGVTAIATVTASPFVDATALPDSTLYYYWVTAETACDGATESGVGVGTEGMAAFADPPAPGNVQATDGDACADITVQWTPVEFVDNYLIYRSEDSDFNTAGPSIGSVTQDLTMFTDSTALNGVTYNYWVVGSNDCGESVNVSASNDGFTGTLDNPDNIATTSVCGGVELAWDDVTNNNGYQVYRGTDPNTWIVDLGFAPSESFLDSPPDPKTPYYYFVTTHNGDCEGVTTVGQYGISMPEATAVQGVDADNVSCDVIELVWTAETWGATYTVWRNTDNVFGDPDVPTAIDIGETTDAFFTDSADLPDGLIANTQYFYWVTTDHTTCGTSPASDVASAISEVPQIGGVAATIGTYCDFVEVNWTDLGQGATYHVWRNTIDDPFGADEVTDVALFPLNSVSTFSPFQDYEALADGTEYYYWVTAEPDACPAEEGDFSDSMFGRRAPAPDSPANVVATLGTTCASVDLQWGGVDFVDQYRIYRADNASALWADAVEIGTPVLPPLTMFTDNTASEAMEYTYWVVSETACGESTAVDGDGVLGYNGELSNPANVLTDVATCDAVTVSWDSITDASGYSIYRTDADIAPVPGGPNPGDVAIAQTFGVGATTHVDDTVVPQTLYYYWVVTNNVACQTLPGISTAGAAVAQPVAPDGLGSTNGDCGAVTVSWTDFAWDVTYHVYRNETGIPPTPDLGVTAIATVTASPFVDATALPDSTLYYYWVTAETACDGATESGVGVGTEGMAAFADPPAPGNVQATDGDACADITVQWTPVEFVDNYLIYRSEDSDFNTAGPSIGSVTQDLTMFTDSTALNGVTYNYWVVGANDCGESVNVSTSNDGFTGTLDNPDNIATTSVCGGVELAWDDVTNNNGYQVYRGTDPNTWIVDLGFAPSESFLDSPPDPKTPYYYFVTTHNGDCEGVTTVGQYGISMPEATAVQGVDADNVSCDVIELVWTAETWGATYTVWRNTDNVFGDPDVPTAIDIGETTDAFFTDSADLPDGLIANTQYFYWVTTDHTTCGTSPASDVASAISEVPQIGGVAATIGTYCDFVEVNWTDLGQGATYHVWRNTIDDPFGADEVTDVALFPLNSVSTFSPFQDYEALADGTEYYYWVTAEPDACPAEEGDFSDSMFGRRAPAPDSPANVVATLGTTCASVDLQWGGVDFVDQYRIYRADNASALWADAVEIGTPVLPPLTMFTDNTASEAMEYTYWVVSETACGESTAVDGDGVLGYNGELSNPANVLTDVATCDAVTVSWDSITDASGYSIYRTDADIAPVPGGPNPGDVAIAQTFGVGATTHVDDTVVPQTLYYYWVVTNNVACQTLPGISTAGAAVAQPVAPDGLGSTNGDCGAVTVSWTDFAWDVTYHVYRNETGIPPTPDLGVTAIATVTASPFVDATALPDSTLYYYWVTAETACDGATESGVGVGTEGMAAFADPPAPGNVQATDGDACADITVQWTPVEFVDNYLIYRSEDSDFNTAGPSIGSVTQDLTMFTDSTALNGVTYNYWVVGSNDCGESVNVSASNDGFTGTLDNPDNIATTSVCGGVELAWDDVTNNNGYQVYRGTDPNTWIVDLGFAPSESFLDSPPDPKTPYYYFVTTHNGDCEGVTTVGQYGISMPEATAVQGVDADNVSCDTIELDWTAENWGATYTVWRNTDNVFGDPTAPTATDIGTTTDAVFTDGTLDANTQYYYWVTTDGSCGQSPASDVASAISEVPLVLGVAATVGTFCDFVEVSWTDLGEAATYHVWRNTVDDPFNADEVTDVALFPLNSVSTFSPFQDYEALADGTTYFYWVTAEPDACGGEEGEYSASMFGRRGNIPINPNPATVFATQGTECGTVNLQWSGEELVEEYVVYRADEANAAWADATEIGTVNSPLTNFADNTADAATQYTYWVTSETSCGEGTAIDGDGVLGYLGSLVGPDGVTATEGTNCGSIDLSWDIVPDALNYVIWRSVTDDFTTSGTIGNTSATTYQDSTNVDDKTIYYYWVTADSQFCPGDSQSESVSGWAMTDLAVVTGVVAGQGDQCLGQGLLVTWDPVENIIRYDIYRNDTGDEPIPGGADPNDTPIDTTTSAIFLDDTAVADTDYYYWVRAVTSCGEGDDIGTFAIGYLAETLLKPEGVGQADPTNCTSILIEWQAVEGAVGYKVHRAVDDDFSESTYLEEVQWNSYSDTTAPEGQTHYYWVEATNACGDSPVSDSATGITASLSSPVITQITTNLCGVVEMSWDAVEGIDEYHIYYSQHPSPLDPAEAIYLGETISTNFTDEAALLDTPIYYWVISVVDPEGINCVSFWGNSAIGQALAPTSPAYNLNASVNEFCNRIRLDWTSDNVGTTTHTIYRGTAESNPDAASVIGSTVETQFFDIDFEDGLPAGTTYYYWVKSETSCEGSDYSVGTHGWTQVEPVNPEFVNATDSGTTTFCNSVNVDWAADPTAETYLVYRSPSGVNNPIQIAETNQLFFQDISVVPGGTYTYTVLSKNDCGSDVINSFSDDGSVGQLGAPGNVSATGGGDGDPPGACGQIDVTWGVREFASGYKVYRSDTTDFTDALLVGIADSTAFTDVSTTIYPMEYDTPYYYFVESVNELCEDPTTHSPAEVGHALALVTIPTDVIATLGTSCENIWINWTVGPNDLTYDIYRNQTGVEPDPTEPVHATVSLPPHVDNVGAGDTDTYYYWVRANNTCPDPSDLSENTWGFAAPDFTDPDFEAISTSATQGTECSQVEISWDQVQGAVIYHIYRNVTDDEATANDIAQGDVITTSPWQDVTALAGQTYFYWVTAENDCSESLLENGQEGWVGVTAQPSGVTASNNVCSMTEITWNEVFDATQYDVYRNTANDFGTSAWAGSTNVTTLDDSGAAPAVEYYYWVTASSEFCDESSQSSAVTGYSLPGIEIPTNVVATQDSLCDEIRLTWDASNQNVVTTYTVYRDSNPNSLDPTPLSPTTTDTTFLDDDPLLVAGIQYYYWVTGENSCPGESPESIVASGTAGEGADSPTIVTATDSGLSSFCNQVVITWAASSGATSYMVYRNVEPNADEAEWIDTTTWPMSIDSSALPATTYYYWVTSVTSCGESLRDDVDNSDSGSLGQLAPPGDLSATETDGVGCGSVELTWTPVEYATAYYVYRSMSTSFPGPDGLIGLAEGDTYLDNQFDDDQFNVPLYYWLESVGEYCDSPATHSQLAEGLSRPPLIAPTTVRSSDGTVCDEVWIDWDEDVNALYFEVWRNTVENSATANLLTDPATAPTTNVYVDSGTFDPDTQYYYWVKTVNTCGTTSFSNSDIGYPADTPSSPIVSVTQGSICDSITLNWGTTPTANRYQIFRSEIVDEESPQYMDEVLTPLTTWTDVNVIPDVDYYYWVAALNDCTTSGTSGDGKRGWIGELAAPTNVQASQLEFCGGITITWDVVANAINYNLYRKLVDLNGDDETLSELIGNSDGATSFVDSNIDPSNQYYYWVKSVNYTICGESDFSSSSIGQSLPPVIVPSEVSATFNEQCGQITIAWVHDEPLTTYTVLRNTVDSVGGAVPVATLLTDTIFIDTQGAGEGQPFTSGIPYFYWVVANNLCGDSDYSQPAALGQGGDDPAQPTGLTASPNCIAVILNWTQVEGATSYQLGRRTSPTGAETVVYDGNQTVYTDLEVILGISYYYEVTARNSCSTSPASDQTSSSATGPPPPTGISATDGTLNCLVSVTWDSVEDATNYRIYRGTDSDVTNTHQIGQQLQSPFIDPSPLPLAYYFVRAITPGCGVGGFSSGDIGSPLEGLPNPGGVNATNGTICNGITISWDTVSGASTYCVYRSVSEGPQTAILQACNISGQSWLDDDISTGVPYWYWVTSESSGDESCNLGIPDQGWSSESLGGIQNLTASQCNPSYIEVEWYGVNSCFDVKRGSTVIATCSQNPYIDFGATGTHNYYVRPRNSCGELGTWEGPVVGILASCLGNDLPEGLLGTEPGDPTILIVPPEINNASKRKGPSAKGTSVGDSESKVNGDDPSIATPPWSLCLVGDAEITTSPILNLGESKWSLPLGGNWRLVGREGYADLFFLGGSDWEHVRSLRVEEIESGIAQSLLEDGIAAVVGTVPEAGTDVLITGVSHEDCDKDGIPDGCEILLGLALDLNIDGVPDSCAADINADGIVDSLDLLEVLEHFGSSINMYGDVTGDGIVDQSDVLAVLMEMSY